jgi:hypothetical protein
MFIPMQGDWTIRVKSKSASFPQQFKISGAATGNGIYAANGPAFPTVSVTGTNWSIAIQHNNGAGFQTSNLRLRFPQIVGSNYEFDLQSDDSGNDGDFNDLILTCSTPVRTNEYLIYGNVSSYSGPCLWNPCFRDWLVIDSRASLVKALENPTLRDAIEKVYKERIPLPFPPEPDPEPFRPLMLNLLNDFQIPPREIEVLSPKAAIVGEKSGKAAVDPLLLTNFKRERIVKAESASISDTLAYNRLELAKMYDFARFRCQKEAASYVNLQFEEYDRTTAEKAGLPYTGTGDREMLGSAATDAFGNYIFRFTQYFGSLLDEFFTDGNSGEVGYIRPDIIGKIVETVPVYQLLYESAPRFNVNRLQRIDYCIPKGKIRPSRQCFNGNLIGTLGNIVLDGAQNTTASFAPAALTRSGTNILSSDGIITVKDTEIAGFTVKCACWAGRVDVKGCLYNARRTANDPIIRYYTIRYKKNPGAEWQYVVQHHVNPVLTDTGYKNQLTGPFPTDLFVDGAAAKTTVSAYKNIQAEAFVDGIPWKFEELGCIMRLDTAIYEADAPGTVYFRVDAYDGAGNNVGTDMIALYISNAALKVGFGNTGFEVPTGQTVESLNCGLYRLFDGNPAGEINQMRIPFKLPYLVVDSDLRGFVDYYKLSFSKCPTAASLSVTAPGPIIGDTTGIIDAGNMTDPTDNDCGNFRGTPTKFGNDNLVEAVVEPIMGAEWLEPGVEYSVYSFTLEAQRRVTNGYNTGKSGTYYATTSVGILRK